MPHLTLPISSAGCSLDVYVGGSDPRRDALRVANLAIPPLIAARMIIDTGASCTAIQETILKSLGLTPTGTSQILTPSSKGAPITCATYDVLLSVYHEKHPLVLGTVAVIGSDFSGQGIDGLIGRDVLQECLMIYDGTAGTFSLAF